MDLETSTYLNASGLAVPMLVFIGLFLLATVSAVFLKKLHFPYTIGLVVIGMLLGVAAEYFDFLRPVLGVNLTRDLIMYVLLPVLVFEASINIQLPALIKELVPVMILAVVGVVLSTLLVAWGLSALTPLSIAGALLFGALISATDPVAVIALFKEVKAPERLSLLMDAESLFNDATAIVMFGVVMTFIQAGGSFEGGLFLKSVLDFSYVFFGGILVGSVLGGAMLFMLKISRGIPFVQIAHTTILALGSFIIADYLFQLSGVMAVIAAGIITRTYGKKAMAEYTQLYIMPYWEFMAFVANSFIFLLLGLKEDLLIKDSNNLISAMPVLMLAVVAVLVARYAVIYLLIPVSNRVSKGEPIDAPSKAIMFWGGLRGVVPVALMLSIPDTVPEKTLIIQMTLTVILFSLLVQGTTIEWLMAKLGIKKRSTPR